MRQLVESEGPSSGMGLAGGTDSESMVHNGQLGTSNLEKELIYNLPLRGVAL
jgi:hypothetical protein